MVLRIVDQTSGEEFASVLKCWRTASQVLKLSTDLDAAERSILDRVEVTATPFVPLPS